MRITLKKACVLIESISRKKIHPEVLRRKLQNGKWPYPHYKKTIPPWNMSIIFLDKKDVLKFAETWSGSKMGRPPGAKNKKNTHHS